MTADTTWAGLYDVGRLINTLSHQLKRQLPVPEEEDSLTTNMQRLVLHYILFESLNRDIYQRDVEKEFQIRRSTATGTLQILEKNGFITRDPVKEDARLKKLTPTAKATGVRQRILDNIHYIEETAGAGHSRGEAYRMPGSAAADVRESVR